MNTTPSHHTFTRLTGFAAASLWHRRLVRTSFQPAAKVQPRLCAELVLHPLRRERDEPSFTDTRRAADAFHAA